MSGEPVFYILKTWLGASYTPNMLGRFVTHFQDPTKIYTLKHPSKHVDIAGFVDKTIDDRTSDDNLLLIVNYAKDSALKCVLRNLLSLDSKNARKRDIEFDSPRIMTRHLKNVNKVFEKLKEELGKEVLEMLPVERNIYFVVGIIVFSTALIRHSGSKSESKHANSTLPLGKIALAAAGARQDAQPGHVDIPMGYGLSTTPDWKTSANVVTGGEQVFAEEYLLVKRDWVGFGKKVIYRDRVPDYMGRSRYAGPDEDEEEEEEEEGQEDIKAVIKEVELLKDGLSPARAGPLGGQKAILDSETGFLYYP